MEQSEQQAFLLPVSYWPQFSATHWWDDFRREDVVRDFNLAYAVGISLLHLAVPWDAGQPHSERVSLTLMRDLEAAMRIASDTGIRCLLSIAVASLFHVSVLPDWLYELTADEHGRPVRVMRRLYEDPFTLEATARLVGEITEEFGDHPGIEGWIIGDGLSSMSPPRSAEHVDEWLDRMRSVMHLHGRRVWHGVSARDLARQSAFDPGTFGQSGFGLLVHVDWKPSWAHDPRLWPAFLVSYIRGLRGLPPLMAGSAQYSLPAAGAPEDSVNESIGEVRAAGAAGLIWPALFDYDPRLRTRPPFSTAPGELARGLLPTGGGLSQTALAWLDASAHPGVVTSGSMPPLDHELRVRDPEGFIRTAYHDFTG